jgi:hypothetical protein
MRYASPVRWEGQSLLCPYPYRAPKDPSRRVRYDRAQLIPEVFLVESAPRRTTPIVAWHEMPDDVRTAVRCDGPFPEHINFFYFHGRNFVTPITSITESRCTHLQESYRTLRDGFLGVAMSQALRARLRSHGPSGTKTIRPSGASH